MAKQSAAPPTQDVPKPRKIKIGRYKSFHLQKKIKSPEVGLPNSFKIIKGSCVMIARNRMPFIGILLVYAVLNLMFVQGSGGLSQTKTALDSLTGGSGLLSSFLVFMYMSSLSGNTTGGAASAYQMVLTLVTSLAIIWTLRQAYAKKKVRIRDSYYQGMYPLVTFMLVIVVILVQLLPIVIGGYLYGLINQGVAATAIEQVIWGLLFIGLATVSLYMLASSLFALYIVCLPNMTPMAALKSARELVRGRRWSVMRKIIFLLIFLFVVVAIIVVPVIAIDTSLASIAFLLGTTVSILLIHSYMYRLYRELL